MGFFDFLKRDELKEIMNLKERLDEAKEKEKRFSTEITTLQTRCSELSKFEELADIEKEKERIISSITEQKSKYESNKLQYKKSIKALKEQAATLSEEIKQKKSEIIELDETILLQEFGLYTPIYDFANSEQYKYRLDAIRTEQKNMILNKTAAKCGETWTLNGSEAQGRVMMNQSIKQIVRCFNDECDILISKVKFNNVTAYKEKIYKSATALNKMNSKHAISLSPKYIELKVEELQLAHEYALKKQEEKEEQRRVREQMREEARLQKEIEDARKDIEKEQKHYANALAKLNIQIESCDDVGKEVLLEKKKEIENHLSDLDVAIKDIDYREANKRAGYVYVISNIGSFGENVYKIGMTRRLDPMERVDELGDASVPFKFDVHAMIFSDDAPALETALHHAFYDRRVNMINGRREFFNVTLEEIEAVVKANYDKTVDFVRMPQAEQYRESQKIIKQLRNI